MKKFKKLLTVLGLGVVLSTTALFAGCTMGEDQQASIDKLVNNTDSLTTAIQDYLDNQQTQTISKEYAVYQINKSLSNLALGEYEAFKLERENCFSSFTVDGSYVEEPNEPDGDNGDSLLGGSSGLQPATISAFNEKQSVSAYYKKDATSAKLLMSYIDDSDSDSQYVEEFYKITGTASKSYYFGWVDGVTYGSGCEIENYYNMEDVVYFLSVGTSIGGTSEGEFSVYNIKEENVKQITINENSYTVDLYIVSDFGDSVEVLYTTIELSFDGKILSFISETRVVWNNQEEASSFVRDIDGNVIIGTEGFAKITGTGDVSYTYGKLSAKFSYDNTEISEKISRTEAVADEKFAEEFGEQ